MSITRTIYRMNNPVILTETVIEREYVTRLRNNKNIILLLVGPTGSGKSWSSISIAEIISDIMGKDWDAGNIVFDTLSFMRKFRELQKRPDEGRHQVIIFDEAGQGGIGARTSQSGSNITFGEILQMLRFTQVSVFFTVPDMAQVDINVRRLFHGILVCKEIDRTRCPKWQKNLSTCRIYKPINNNLPGDKSEVKTACPVVSVVVKNAFGESFLRNIKVPQIWLRKPRDDNVIPYEAAKRHHFAESLRKAEAKLMKIERKQNPDTEQNQHVRDFPEQEQPTIEHTPSPTAAQAASMRSVQAETRSVINSLLSRGTSV